MISTHLCFVLVPSFLFLHSIYLWMQLYLHTLETPLVLLLYHSLWGRNVDALYVVGLGGTTNNMQVTKMQPKSKEAAAKLKASEKMQKEAAFAAAIMTDADVPLAEEINPDEIGTSVIASAATPVVVAIAVAVQRQLGITFRWWWDCCWCGCCWVCCCFCRYR